MRLLHLYLGTFFAPSIIFFSLTGAAQVINLHETTPGSSYHPPVWLEQLAQVHKKQTLAMRPKGGAPPRPANAEARSAGEGKPEGGVARVGQARNTPPPMSLGTYLQKRFFFVMSLGLTITTLLGIYMAFKYNRDRRMIWGMLIVGTVLPLSLLFF